MARSKTYVDSYATTELEVHGTIGEEKEYNATVSYTVDIDDGEIGSNVEIKIQSINSNSTGMKESYLKEVLETALEENSEIESLSEGDSWESEADADEDVNGYIVSFNTVNKNIEIEIEEDEIIEAKKILKKYKAKKILKNKMK